MNFTPVPVGGVLLMYNNSNPAELYQGTTWELLATDKYLRTTTSTPLSTGGSNSVTITKANLPDIQLSTEAHIHTQPAHTHKFYVSEQGAANQKTTYGVGGAVDETPDTSSAGGDNVGSASPKTEKMGSGTPITITPAYITIRAWKRLS